MQHLAFAAASAAFIGSVGWTLLALAEERERHALAGLAFLIFNAIVAGNLAGGICG